MANDVALECSCGKLRGRVRDGSPNAGFRLVCYCEDCRAFARYLGREDEILDSAGGTEIFQTSPARVEILEGTLDSMRLGPRGLIRWSSACCDSPIGNTVSGDVPFVGLIVPSLRDEADRLGPVRARVQTREARGDVSGDNVFGRFAVALGLRLMGRILMSRLRGEHKKSPFFDPETGKPVREPNVLSESERRALEPNEAAS